jgi:HrpA-like RNA helicase
LGWLEFLSDGNVTTDGQRALQLQLEPQLARVVLASEGLECSLEIIKIAAMLSVADSVLLSWDGKLQST